MSKDGGSSAGIGGGKSSSGAQLTSTDSDLIEEEEEEEEVDEFEHRPPACLDDELLRKLVNNQGPTGVAGTLAREEGIDFDVVTKLNAGRLRILEVSNLWPFTALVELLLDNNLIEKIENLEELIHLERLDLSFNQIEVIEGLSKLVNLKDLSLFCNNIRSISGMDSLHHIEIFSIGRNKLDKLDNLIYLRRFERLRSLVLHGNPFCTNSHYRDYVAAFLPRLVYLDARPFPEEGLAERADDKFGLQAGIKQEEEDIERNNREKQREIDKIYKEQSAAYIEDLVGPVGLPLDDALYVKDPDFKLFRTVPALLELEKSYRSKIQACCQAMFDQGQVKYEERKREMEDFEFCTQLAISESRAKSIQLVDSYKLELPGVWLALSDCMEEEEVDEAMTLFNDRLDQVLDQLLYHEMLLVDQLEEGINSLTRSMGDSVSLFLEFCHHQMSEIRGHVTNHHELFSSLALNLTEQLTVLKEEKGIDEKVVALFMDRDYMITSVKNNLDYHLLTVDLRDDRMMKSAHAWLTDLGERLHNDLERERNRERVREIIRLIDTWRRMGENAAEEFLDNIEVDKRKKAAAMSERVMTRRQTIKFKQSDTQQHTE